MKVQIPTLGTIDVEVSVDDIERAIMDKIEDQVSYQLRAVVDTEMRAWIKELMDTKKAELIARLSPEIDKQLKAVTLGRNTY